MREFIAEILTATILLMATYTIAAVLWITWTVISPLFI